MTDQTTVDIKITITIMLFAALSMALSIGCEKKCGKREVKVNGKCYELGASYRLVNGKEYKI